MKYSGPKIVPERVLEAQKNMIAAALLRYINVKTFGTIHCTDLELGALEAMQLELKTLGTPYSKPMCTLISSYNKRHALLGGLHLHQQPLSF